MNAIVQTITMMMEPTWNARFAITLATLVLKVAATLLALLVELLKLLTIDKF